MSLKERDMGRTGGSWVVRVPFPAVIEDIAARQDAVIEASAGTGKTYTLEHLFVDLLVGSASHFPLTKGNRRHAPLQIGQILLVTFTEKAVQELSVRCHRLLSSLSEMFAASLHRQGLRPADASAAEGKDGAAPGFCTVDSPSSPCPGTCAECLKRRGAGKSDLPHCWNFGVQERHRVKAALESFESANIFTIHSFCQRSLREEAFRGKAGLSQRVVDADEFFARVFRKCLRDDFQRDEEAREAIQNWLDATLPIEAPSETQKLDKSLETLLLKTQGPEKIAGEDGTQTVRIIPGTEGDSQKFETARVLAPILWRALEEEKRRDSILTFDDMLTRLDGAIQDETSGIRQALAAKYRCILVDEFQDTDSVQWRILDALRKCENGSRLMIIGDPKQSIYRFRGADLCTYEDARAAIQGAAPLRLSTNFRTSAELIAAFNNLFDPDASSAPFAAETISQGTNAEEISKWTLETLRDVSGRGEKREVVSAGLPPASECSAASQPVFYREKRGTAVRSDDQDAVRRFLTHAEYGSPSVEAGADGLGIYADADGKKRAAPLCALELSISREKPRGRSWALSQEAIRSAAANLIAREILRLTHPDSPMRISEGGTLRRIRCSDIFVLVRDGKQLAKAVESALDKLEIPWAFQTGNIFEGDTALEIAQVLRAIASPGESALAHRAALTPFLGVSPEELASGGRGSAEGHILEKLNSWKALADRGAFARLFELLSEEANPRWILADNARSLSDCAQVFDLLLDEIGEKHLSLPEVIDWLDSRRSGRDTSGDDETAADRPKPWALAPPSVWGEGHGGSAAQDAVQILTMHSSKGLEAPIVFVADALLPRSARGSVKDSCIPLSDGRMAVDEGVLNKDMLNLLQSGQSDDSFVDKPDSDSGQPSMAALTALSLIADAERLIYVAMTRAKVRLYVFKVPIHPDCGGNLCAGSSWNRMNLRLLEAFKQSHSAPPEGFFPTPSPVPNSPGASGPQTMSPEKTEQAIQALLNYAKDIPHSGDSLQDAPRRALITTSYSQLKRVPGAGVEQISLVQMPRGLRSALGTDADDASDTGSPLSHAAEAALSDAEEDSSEVWPADADGSPADAPSEEMDALRGGSEVGIYVHALFEKVPKEQICLAKSAEELARSETFRAVSRREQIVLGLSLGAGDEVRAAEMVWKAMRTPVLGFGPDGAPASLLELGGEVLHEVEFLFPLPERSALSAGASQGETSGVNQTASAHRGFVTGFIDAVFRDASGRCWFIDWKSNVLASASAEGIAANFEAHYALQARLYAAALTRYLGIRTAEDFERRFGGCAYFYVRYVGGPNGRTDEGVHAFRPAFQDILDTEEALARAKKAGPFVH